MRHRFPHLPRCTVSDLHVCRWRLAARARTAVRARHRARELDQQALVQVARAALDALPHLLGSSGCHHRPCRTAEAHQTEPQSRMLLQTPHQSL